MFKDHLYKIIPFFFITGLMVSCGDDDSSSSGEEAPTELATLYDFEQAEPSYRGQTDRILMGAEILTALKDITSTEQDIDNMYSHIQGEENFFLSELNESSRQLRNKTAGSFSAADATIAPVFDGWIADQVSEIFPVWNSPASAGVAGLTADNRRVNTQGLEYDQLFNKSMVGAVMVDQIVYNYIDPDFLDNDIAANDIGTPHDTGLPYTTMEHHWDEGFGYLFGGIGTDNGTSFTANAVTAASPNDADRFLNRYLYRVDADPSFDGLHEELYQAFVTGRQAIGERDYATVNEQIDIIHELVSFIIGVRSVYYLKEGEALLAPGDNSLSFHDLSEGYGFIYSLQFTRVPGTSDPYFSAAEVDGFLTDMLDDGENGLWDVEASTLDGIATEIASRFDFTVAEAADNQN